MEEKANAIPDPGNIPSPGMAEIVDVALTGFAKSETIRRHFREAYGADYPEEAEPSSFVTLTDLELVSRLLHVMPGQTIIDLGCGRGGPGMWVARKIGADLVGIDISRVGVEHATHRVSSFGLDGHARFQVADFTDTGVPDAAFDGAISIDSLWVIQDKAAALSEVARILHPGARFVFTTWEARKVMVDPLYIMDYHPLLGDAGFEIEVYDETPEWEERQQAVYDKALADQAKLILEMGETAATLWIAEAQINTTMLSELRRVLVAARRL